MKAPKLTSDQCLIHSSQVEWERLIGSPRVKKSASFRNNIQISKPEMAKYFGCPQRLAAQKLGVSLSTLKRRFYQLGLGRWPYQTHETNRRSIWHMVNEVEPKSEKYLSPETVQTLTHLFSMSLQEQQQLATGQHPLSQGNHSINRKETNFKFLHYVPTSERSLQSENQTNSIHKGVQKRPRRFLQLDAH